MDDLFRHGFGFNNPNGNAPNFGGEDDNEEFPMFGDGDEDPFKDSFFHFEGHLQKQMESMSRQMEEMFKNFGAVQFPSDFEHQQGRALPDNPRNSMLKGPEPGSQEPSREIFPLPPRMGPPPRFGRFHGFTPKEEKKDTDLDSEIRGQEDLGKLFGGDKVQPRVPQMPGPQMPRNPGFWSQGSSRSYSKTFINGRVQEEETIHHADGRREKIVTQKDGDKTHTTKYITDKQGNTEKIENFNNMDEKDLPSFRDGWSQGRQPMLKGPESESPNPSLNRQDDKSFLRSLFDFWKWK